jgi:hypothetical protein
MSDGQKPENLVAQRLGGAEDEEAAAPRQILEEIESQCVSHGRHPAEWDNVNLCWVERVRSDSYIFCLNLG